MGTVIGKGPCDNCKRTGGDWNDDNLIEYEDGGAHCFACGFHRFADGSEGQQPQDTPTTTTADLPRAGTFESLPDRRITVETCRKYRYTVDDDGNHLAFYQRGGQWAYCHHRSPAKEFWGVGKRQGVELYGQHMFQARKGSSILTITEGELDALAAFQIMLKTSGRESAVVSICGGVNNAVANIRDNYEWVVSFDTIVLAFDADEPGQKAAREVAEILPAGRVKIMVHPPGLKDACDYLKNGKEEAFVTAWWAAKVYRPDGILHISEISRDRSKKPIYPFRHRQLTQKFVGREAGEIVLVGSGSGMGKTTEIMWSMLYDAKDLNLRVGAIMLESTPQDTKYDLASLFVRKPVRKILGQRKLREVDPTLSFEIKDDLTDLELDAALDKVESLPLYVYDHRGSLDSKNLVSKLRHLAVGCGCQVIYLDHITLAVAGGEGDERKDIDALMKSLVSLCQETQVVMVVVCQFARPQGKPYEEGAETHSNSFRGSGAIYQAAHIAIGMERNQQAPTDEEKSTVTFRSLKARRSGYTGVLCTRFYNAGTGDLEDKWSRPMPFISREKSDALLEAVK